MIKILRPTEEQKKIWTATTSQPCDHRTGWFVRVPFWIFWKYVFVCSNCGKVMKPKEAKKW